MFNIAKYREIQKNIEKLGKKTKIIAVSKNHPAEAIKKAIEDGVRIFGENRVQEAKKKFSEINNKNLEIHLTGPLQTNKVSEALKIFNVFHTLDRKKLAIEFNKNHEKLAGKKFFIQINTGKESTKSGVYPESADEFVNFCKGDLGLNIVGLMCIPPINESAHDHFQLLKDIATRNNVHELSIGMSSDYQDAINLGASYIRIGTAFFGKR